MSARPKRRPAFAADALNDLDDILPAVKPASSAAEQLSMPSASAVSTASNAEPEAVTPAEVLPPPRLVPPIESESASDTGADTPRPGRATPEPRRRGRETGSPAGARPARQFVPEVAIAPDVAELLRALTLRERSTHAVTARSYGRVALDAIDAHAGELQRHWRASGSATAAATGGGGSLFSRNIAPQRRRHQTPPARVALAGISIEDTRQLDRLAEDWGAGNRSELVEQALRLYLSTRD